MTPYTLPEPAWIHEERNLNSSYTIPVFTADQMRAAFAAGAASRDDILKQALGALNVCTIYASAGGYGVMRSNHFAAIEAITKELT